MRSKVDPMKDVARLIRRHFDGIVAWTQTRQTSGFIEAINGLFQAAKRKARGYACFETMRTVLFLIAGKLNFARFSEHARRAPLPTPFSKEPKISTSASMWIRRRCSTRGET
jgi:transposase